MKTRRITILSAFLLILSVSTFAKKTPVSQPFFTKSDFSNWIYILRDKAVNPVNVFKMDNGVLQITGISSGYLRTKKTYSNFELSVEWRWTTIAANSGVLVHIQPKDSVWPVCYQVNQKADAAGDIICMNGLWAKECTDSVRFTVKKMQPSNEKPVGEWNSMKVISKNKTLKVFVNGMLQNYITGLTAGEGFIGFQNEGKPLEFKSLSIKELK
ncbi:MAG: DUF1080 domain-containing protein [Paludibacter sp.]|nr:DUF1080 domain-containing protein [Paludibacter sp.]